MPPRTRLSVPSVADRAAAASTRKRPNQVGEAFQATIPTDTQNESQERADKHIPLVSSSDGVFIAHKFFEKAKGRLLERVSRFIKEHPRVTRNDEAALQQSDLKDYIRAIRVTDSSGKSVRQWFVGWRQGG